jgi:O-6-methylguanine DNA methyltransferase
LLIHRTKEQFVYRKTISTPLGKMCARACDVTVHELFFSDEFNDELDGEFGNEKSNPILEQLEKELYEYFEKRRREFTVPLFFAGTSFQKRVWTELLQIPYGKSISYGALAESMGHKTAYRAVASAIGQNKIALLVPCHRVIYQDGALGGYRWGGERKKWLFEHEGC